MGQEGVGIERAAGGAGEELRHRVAGTPAVDMLPQPAQKRAEIAPAQPLRDVRPGQNGRLEEPLAIYRDLLPKWKDLGHRAAVAHELECIAYILSKMAQPQRAVTILGAADSLRKRIDSLATPVELDEYERELSAMRDKMDEVEFEKAWEAGRKLGMDEAIELAVQE